MPADSVIAILAGGVGSRLWPLSTAERPKQFVPLFAGRSMLQKTFERASKAVGSESVYLVGSARHADLYAEQLPELPSQNLILEPTGRGTAAALALTAKHCAEAAPGAAVATIPSDHIIPEPGGWIDAIRIGLDFARHNDYLVCLGVKPGEEETKFGYLAAGDAIGGTELLPVLSVERFVEKPDAGELRRLVSHEHSFRNMGTLAFRPEVLASEMERLLPEVYVPVSKAAGESPTALERAYADIPTHSIDTSVLQHSDRLAVVAANIASKDAGDFVTLGDAIGRDDRGNAANGRVVAVDASENTVFASDVTVALVGVSGLVVVVEGDRILVCPAAETQRIKQIPDKG